MNAAMFPIHQAALEFAAKQASGQLKATRSRLMTELGQEERPSGLTPDAVKFHPEFRLALTRCNLAMSALRNFNGKYASAYRAGKL